MDVDAVFRALSDPTRRILVEELAERDEQTLFELCVRLISRHGLEVSRQAVAKHLDVLEGAGLVVVRRKGRYRLHTLDRAPLRATWDEWFRPLVTSENPDDRPTTGVIMRINLTSVLVDDQSKALAFYTEVLGFEKKTDVPTGDARWLTVVSPEDPDGVELLLEPEDHPAAGPFKQALVADGIPFTSFAVDDVEAEHARLVAAGVEFTQQPTVMGPVTTAVFDDTCGNLIQIASAASA